MKDMNLKVLFDGKNKKRFCEQLSVDYNNVMVFIIYQHNESF